jgi:hypothetical protein
MTSKRVVRPCFHRKIAIHQQLAKAEEAELDAVGIDFPTLALGDDLLDAIEISAGVPIFLDLKFRQVDTEVVF